MGKPKQSMKMAVAMASGEKFTSSSILQPNVRLMYRSWACSHKYLFEYVSGLNKIFLCTISRPYSPSANTAVICHDKQEVGSPLTLMKKVDPPGPPPPLMTAQHSIQLQSLTTRMVLSTDQKKKWMATASRPHSDVAASTRKYAAWDENPGMLKVFTSIGAWPAVGVCIYISCNGAHQHCDRHNHS